MKGLLGAVLATVLLSIGCTNARHVAVAGDVAYSQAVFALDDAQRNACAAKVLAADACAKLEPVITSALKNVISVTAAIQAAPKSGVVPTSLPDLLSDLTQAQAVLAPLATAGGPIAEVGGKATDAVTQAIALLRLIAGGK